uniref:C-type lectin domain-containing protein n=1 Tax=Oryzias latipes TaxID=8090 RepID=A0A3B3I261_ORYLA
TFMLSFTLLLCHSSNMFVFVLVGLALMAVSPSDGVELESGNCPEFSFYFQNRCYRYFATQRTWTEAESDCVSEGLNLVSIHSPEEQRYVKFLISNFDTNERATWIGYTDAEQEGVWLWSDRTIDNYQNWNRGEPNNYNGPENCAVTNWGFFRRWNDINCSEKFPFLCASRKL